MADLTKSEVRIQLLNQKEKDATTGQISSIYIGTQQFNLAEFSIKNDIPRFRKENGRIKDKILALEADPAAKAILADPDSEAAQDLIYDALKDLVKLSNLEKLIRDAGIQQEPLIITYDGTVVNGNRRLAVMRRWEIAENYVKVIRLPKSTTDLEVRSIELTLQMDNPGKADYTWVNQILTIQENLAKGMTETELHSAMKGHSKADVKKMIEMIKLIDQFLERRGTPGAYSVIGDKGQYFFDELAKSIKRNAKFPERADALLWSAVNYFESPPDDGAEDRSYLKLQKLGKQIALVVHEFRPLQEQTESVGDPNDPFFGISSAASPFATLAVSPETSQAIHDVVLKGISKDLQSKDAAALFDTLIGIARKLSSVEGGPGTANLEGILKQISTIEAEIDRLKKWAISLRKDN
jgi:hypothetical protein